MGSIKAILKNPDDFFPLLKLKIAARNAEKQIPPEPHWGFCYSMLHKVSRSFGLVIQQLGPELRDAVSFSSQPFNFFIFFYAFCFSDSQLCILLLQVCIFYLVLRALDTVGSLLFLLSNL